MTSDEFIAWPMERPATSQYELSAREIVATAPERSVHAATNLHIARRLAEAIETVNVPCWVYPDGRSLRVDDREVYESHACVAMAVRRRGRHNLSDPNYRRGAAAFNRCSGCWSEDAR